MHGNTIKAEQRRLEKLREREERETFLARNERMRQEREARENPHPDSLIFLGESSPTVNADTLHDALVSALRFSKAYRLPALPEGSSLHDYEKRNWLEACRTRLAHIFPDDFTLAPCLMPKDIGVNFFDRWTPLAGATGPLTVEQINAALAEIKNVTGDSDGNSE